VTPSILMEVTRRTSGRPIYLQRACTCSLWIWFQKSWPC